LSQVRTRRFAGSSRASTSLLTRLDPAVRNLAEDAAVPCGLTAVLFRWMRSGMLSCECRKIALRTAIATSLMIEANSSTTVNAMERHVMARFDHADVMTKSSLAEARLRLSALQHVQDSEMPLIFGIEGRQVFRRAQCDLMDVEALAGSRQRHRGIYQHVEPHEAGCNDERRCENDWLVRHGFVPEVAESRGAPPTVTLL
jgi:hypothetical protein